MIKAVLFDMDGVLIDSEPAWVRSLKIIVHEQGKKFDAAEHRTTLGMKGQESMKAYKQYYGLNGSVNQLWSKRKQIINRLFRKKLTMKPGAMGLLRWLKMNNFKIALATSGPDDTVMFVYRKFRWERFFTAVETGDDVKHSKPDPEIYLKAARKLGITPSACAVIEDAPKGVAAAKKAGMTAIALLTKYSSRKKLRRADFIITRFSQAKKLLS